MLLLSVYPPRHELQFPAGNSPLQEHIEVPYQQELKLRCTGLTVVASAAGDSFCVASPLIASMPTARYFSYAIQHVREGWPLQVWTCCMIPFTSLPSVFQKNTPVISLSVKRVPRIWLSLLETFSSGWPVVMRHLLNKYADVKEHLRIIFKPWVWTGWKVFARVHLPGWLLGRVSSVPTSQISGFCWVGFLPWGKCLDSSLALKPLTHNSYFFLKSYMWSLPWEVSRLRSMQRPLSHFWIIQRSISAWMSSTRKRCPTSWLGKEGFHQGGKAICYPGRATCIQGSANMLKDFLGQEWTFNAFPF